ncbi:MAG: ACT domain-containing protein [Myxococcota bacterium]|nr:ACT domain-containing protein [Myxococcota bacterium]
MPSRTLDLLPDLYGVARLDPNAAAPAWAEHSPLSCITRTPTELSVLCRESEIPSDVVAQRGFRGLRVRGPLDFSELGVLSSLAEPLAAEGIPILAVSSYDTDYLFVPAADLDSALACLEAAGHIVSSAPA